MPSKEKCSTSLRHFRLDEVQRDFVLADVIWHIAVGVDRQQVGIATAKQ